MAKEKKIRRKYTEDFKRDAVALVTEQGYKVSEAAMSLGINDNMLRRWRQELEDEVTGTQLSTDEREELNRLRKEVRRLRMEKEILKKASQYFAKEMK
jgi:transposase